MKSQTLSVPGATLYYEVRGAGPVPLLLPGGGGDAAIFDVIAAPLAERYTVVAFDPRGYLHSALDGPPVEQRVEVQSDDAFRLIEAVVPVGERAYVFGGSSGAIVALDLLARHPDRLHRVVAHEPPCFAVLPDAAEQLAFVEEVSELSAATGWARPRPGSSTASAAPSNHCPTRPPCRRGRPR